MPVGALVDVGPGAEAVSLPGWALPAEPVVVTVKPMAPPVESAQNGLT